MARMVTTGRVPSPEVGGVWTILSSDLSGGVLTERFRTAAVTWVITDPNSIPDEMRATLGVPSPDVVWLLADSSALAVVWPDRTRGGGHGGDEQWWAWTPARQASAESRACAPLYSEPHWYTGKEKIRCSACGKVAYPTEEEATLRAAQISERTPMKVYLGPRCGHWHVARSKGKTKGKPGLPSANRLRLETRDDGFADLRLKTTDT